MSLRIQPLRTADEPELRRVFRSTIALGHPVSREAKLDAALRPYERLCLEWYLRAGRDHAYALRDDDRVVGYALVCVEPEAFARWQRHAGARFTAHVVPRLLLRRYPSSVRRFYRLRLRDGWDLWRHSEDRTAGLPHAHFNATTMGGLPGRLLADHVDAVVAAAGFDSWYGEMNARARTARRRAEPLGRRDRLPPAQRHPQLADRLARRTAHGAPPRGRSARRRLRPPFPTPVARGYPQEAVE
jgi:hypothetical protein